MSTITWLHVSDLHFRADDEHNRKIVLSRLLDDIKARTDERDGLDLDFIVFTGDVAWHGWEDEYKLAEDHFFWPLLEITQLSPKELFIVPGNHDVDWAIVDMLPRDIPSRLKSRDAVNDFLASDKKRQMVFQSLKAYTDFVRRLFAGHWSPEDPAYYYVRTLKKGNTKTAVLGLNSAWLSGFAKKDSQVDDYGNLLVGERQVAEAVEKAQEADIKIVLMHHPFEWLQEFDRGDVESWLRKECHFILRGHRHRAGFIQELTLEGEIVTIPAGAAYDRREYPNGYDFVRLDLGQGVGTMHLRRYDDRHRHWVRDVGATHESRDGRMKFFLPKDLRVAPVLAVEIPPVDKRLLRDFDKALQWLAHTFLSCEEESRQTRYANRMLHEDEYAEVKKAWDKSQKAYSDVQARASLIPLEDRSKGLFKSLEKAYRSLKQAIDGASLKLIPERVHNFGMALGSLQTQVSAEVDRFIY